MTYVCKAYFCTNTIYWCFIRLKEQIMVNSSHNLWDNSLTQMIIFLINKRKLEILFFNYWAKTYWAFSHSTVLLAILSHRINVDVIVMWPNGKEIAIWKTKCSIHTCHVHWCSVSVPVFITSNNAWRGKIIIVAVRTLTWRKTHNWELFIPIRMYCD